MPPFDMRDGSNATFTQAEKTMHLCNHTVLLGGSFNPPHMGHHMACLYLLDALQSQEVWLVPVFCHPFGKTLETFEHRAAMCRMLTSTFGNRVQVSMVEKTRGLSGRTYDTVLHLQKQFPDRRFALAIGADILKETQSWYRFDDLKNVLPITILGRQGYAHPDPNLVQLPEISSSCVRKRLKQQKTIEGLVPARVAQYIVEQGLYGCNP